jgi:hypothetical protein
MLRFKAFAGRLAHSVSMRIAPWVMLLVVAATPTPAPVALQYDQIARVIVAPATPPAPGGFSDDYKVAMSARPVQTVASSFIQTPAETPTQQQAGHPMVGPVSMPGEPGGSNTAESIGDAVSSGAGQSATSSRSNAAARATHAGYLIRYTLYVTKGWMREDDPVMQTATIMKCDEHTLIFLNLAKKTYVQTPSDCSQPSTGNPAIDRTTTQDLGSLTIDGIPTTGSQSNACVVYVSKIPKPDAMPAQDACEQMSPMLGMYVLTNTTVNGRAVHNLTERGHVTALDASAADPLFEVPAGFSPAR